MNEIKAECLFAGDEAVGVFCKGDVSDEDFIEAVKEYDKRELEDNAGCFTPDMIRRAVVRCVPKDGNVYFYHYGSARANAGFVYFPQFYEFKKGRSYIVFAKITETTGVLRQLWKSHRLKMDQGLFLAADDQPIPRGRKLREIIWEELSRLLFGEISALVLKAQ